METTTETSPHHRELTATEIKIAIAQIEDRLMCVAKAQTDLYQYFETAEAYDLTNDDNGPAKEYEESLEERKKAELRQKYDIPEQVHLFFEGVDAALTKSEASICKPHLAAFVKGKLTEAACEDLVFFFEECAECDYGWILVERTMGFYDCESDDDIDDIKREIVAIGTRSRAKNRKLPRIAGPFSSHNSLFANTFVCLRTAL